MSVLRCVVLKNPREMVLEDRPLPAGPTKGWALIKVKAVGICGSDIHAYRGTQPFQTYPRIPGHEMSGVLARPTSRLREGQLVTVEPLLRCGKCYPCRQGRYNCCVHLKVMGVHADGAMCEYVRVPERLVYPLPEKIPADQAALCEPVAVACQAVKRARVVSEDAVLVIGAGPIGLLVVQVARAQGAKVFASDIDPDRLRLAERLGADATINAKRQDLSDVLKGLTDGDGPNVVVEAVGSEPTISQAIEVVSAAGRVALVGLMGDTMPFKPITLIRKELDVLGCRNSSGMFQEAIRLIADGQVNVVHLITHRFSFDEGPQVFRRIDEGQIRSMKTILFPTS